MKTALLAIGLFGFVSVATVSAGGSFDAMGQAIYNASVKPAGVSTGSQNGAIAPGSAQVSAETASGTEAMADTASTTSESTSATPLQIGLIAFIVIAGAGLVYYAYQRNNTPQA